MIPFEIFTLLISSLAVLISFIALIRTRESAELRQDLDLISTQIAQKQLDALNSSEDLARQPRYAIHMSRLVGYPDLHNGYKARIDIDVTNSGDKPLKEHHVILCEKIGRTWRLPQHAQLKTNRSGPDDPTVGKHYIMVKPGAVLNTCTILISYLDVDGQEMFQEFHVFADGGSDEFPQSVSFSLKEIHKIIPSEPWLA